jgi:hypothetical protein
MFALRCFVSPNDAVCVFRSRSDLCLIGPAREQQVVLALLLRRSTGAIRQAVDLGRLSIVQAPGISGHDRDASSDPKSELGYDFLVSDYRDERVGLRQRIEELEDRLRKLKEEHAGIEAPRNLGLEAALFFFLHGTIRRTLAAHPQAKNKRVH